MTMDAPQNPIESTARLTPAYVDAEVARRMAADGFVPTDREWLGNQLAELRDVINFAEVGQVTGVSPITVAKLAKREPVKRWHVAKTEAVALWLSHNYEDLLMKRTEREDELEAKALRMAARHEKLAAREQIRLERALARSAGRYWSPEKFNVRKWTDADLVGFYKEVVAEIKRRKEAKAALAAQQEQALAATDD